MPPKRSHPVSPDYVHPSKPEHTDLHSDLQPIMDFKQPELKRQKTNDPKKENSWINHVKETALKNNVSYRSALSIAKDTYVRPVVKKS